MKVNFITADQCAPFSRFCRATKQNVAISPVILVCFSVRSSLSDICQASTSWDESIEHQVKWITPLVLTLVTKTDILTTLWLVINILDSVYELHIFTSRTSLLSSEELPLTAKNYPSCTFVSNLAVKSEYTNATRVATV